ncbi:MAG: response regulator [Nitrospina sp.]|jgi:two-component system, OmpR family, alkaline phosphatase synthesis response regulator PhoP|nr:response regulator [Nitrospina sp.]MBT5633246.1 response regulator [Nitrospina sp.]
MTQKQILVVEDEEGIQELVKYNLTKENYQVHCVGSGELGLQQAKKELPDLLVLDLMLPGMNGLEVCRQLKNDSNTNQIPIIMMTAKGEESDIVVGLELGADDYITKPFSVKIFLSRVKAVLRRKQQSTSSESTSIVFPDLEIHLGKHEVYVKGKLIKLTLTEFKILEFLADKPGWVFTRGQIVDTVRGNGYAITDRAIDFQIVGLRKKLGKVSKYIETVRGVGYRFAEI